MFNWLGKKNRTSSLDEPYVNEITARVNALNEALANAAKADIVSRLNIETKVRGGLPLHSFISISSITKRLA
jgi:hypothetical protein